MWQLKPLVNISGDRFKKILELNCMTCLIMFRWIKKQPEEEEDNHDHEQEECMEGGGAWGRGREEEDEEENEDTINN